jgi:hypothetical protein
MNRWEYRVESWQNPSSGSSTSESLEDFINRTGDEGFELLQIVDSNTLSKSSAGELLLVFKRQARSGDATYRRSNLDYTRSELD